MPQSFSNVAVHIIYSTKKHSPFLSDAVIRSQTHAYLAGICKATGCPPIIVGGWIDHVHVFCLLNRTCSISNLLKELKIESSKWLKTKGPSLTNFSWQAGYAAYAVSDSMKESVFDYIRKQEDHHRRKTFIEEYIQFLKDNKITYDERYVWD